jgi:predicted DNA-binding transcriptional regulator
MTGIEILMVLALVICGLIFGTIVIWALLVFSRKQVNIMEDNKELDNEYKKVHSSNGSASAE